MKKIVHPISLCLLSLGLCIGSNSFAQENKTTTIEKQIEVSDDNGEMTVKITTTKDGKTTVKELKGNEAKSFVEKHHEKGTMHHGGKKMHKKRFVTNDVDVSEKNGEKVEIAGFSRLSDDNKPSPLNQAKDLNISIPSRRNPGNGLAVE